MALSIGASQKGTSTTSPVTTASMTSQATGSTFIAFMMWEGATFTSIADSKSNTWSLLGSEQAFGPGSARCRMYSCVNGTGGASHTVTLTTGAGSIYASLFLLELLGVATSSAQDGTTQQGTDSASPYTRSITTTNADDVLIAGISTNSGTNPSSLSESSGFTIQQEQTNATIQYTGGIATRIVSAIDTYTPSFTQTGGASTSGMILVAFKAAAGGASIAPRAQAHYRRRRYA